MYVEPNYPAELPPIYQRPALIAWLTGYMQVCADRENDANAAADKLAVEGYLATVARNRELGIAEPAKPEAPLLLAVVFTEEGWPDIQPTAFRLRPPVPDLPFPAAPPAGLVVKVGPKLAEGVYACLAGDNAPWGYRAEAADGTAVVKLRGTLGFGMYARA